MSDTWICSSEPNNLLSSIYVRIAKFLVHNEQMQSVHSYCTQYWQIGHRKLPVLCKIGVVPASTPSLSRRLSARVRSQACMVAACPERYHEALANMRAHRIRHKQEYRLTRSPIYTQRCNSGSSFKSLSTFLISCTRSFLTTKVAFPSRTITTSSRPMVTIRSSPLVV